MAMTVLYARQVLTALLAYWPMEGRIITAQLLGCKHSSHIPFVLDLLHRPEARDMFQKVILLVLGAVLNCRISLCVGPSIHLYSYTVNPVARDPFISSVRT